MSKAETVLPQKNPTQNSIIFDSINQRLNLGVKYCQSGQLSEAEACFQQVLQWQPNNPDAWHLLGVISAQQKKYLTAIERIEQAIKLKPSEATFFSNLGNIYLEQQEFSLSCKSYQKVLELQPQNADIRKKLAITCEKLLDSGIEHQQAGRRPEAEICYQYVLKYQPRCADAWHLWGLIAYDEKNYLTAIKRINRAIELNSKTSTFHNSLGGVYWAQKDFTQAVKFYQKAIQLQADFQPAHNNLVYVSLDQGKALAERGELTKAIASCEQARQIKPDSWEALILSVYWRRKCCHWEGLDISEKSLIKASQTQQWSLPPFMTLVIADAPAKHLTAAQNYVSNVIDHSSSFLWKERRAHHDKLRLAYLSADYHQHATAYLMTELFERHDRSRFELFAISFGPESNSPMRQRLVKAFDHFIDVNPMSDFEAAQQIRNLEIDIAVDLKGYTKDSRPGILAHRPAPIQVNYLGYPGTMGADFIDYILVDPFIVPPDQQPYFTEKLVYLPECYQVNDSQRTIADYVPSRQECGLPEQGFVFCSFNNSYKIAPTFFALWMRLLKAVPGSVLWLLGDNKFMEENLAKEAQARGVNPNRLIFASRQKLPEHLARHQLADLFLDNLPYNAHTTTSDALWTGLPVLTCAGRSFAARVASSLLYALGLPELVTYNLEDYEALALKLATQPDLLSQIKQKLQQNRLSTSLFDCNRFRRHIEAAYIEMWSIWQRGEGPKAFAVSKLLD